VSALGIECAIIDSMVLRWEARVCLLPLQRAMIYMSGKNFNMAHSLPKQMEQRPNKYNFITKCVLMQYNSAHTNKSHSPITTLTHVGFSSSSSLSESGGDIGCSRRVMRDTARASRCESSTRDCPNLSASSDSRCLQIGGRRLEQLLARARSRRACPGSSPRDGLM